MQAHPRPRPSCSGVLPNFCTIGTLFGVVLVVQLLVFVLLLTMGWPEGQVWERLSLLSLLAQWIALGTTALLCLLRRPLRRLGDSGEGLAAWLLLMGITAVALEVVATLGATWPGVLFSAREDRWGLLLRGLGISGILGAMVLRYFYLHHQWQRQQIARAEALFQALQARIRPHFLFNSMNTIASLTRSDPALAEAVVEDLADLFRAALSDAAGQSSLGRELELARGYLRVEQLQIGRAHV
jgi:two-component system sensor histidine kinase AlgZ